MVSVSLDHLSFDNSNFVKRCDLPVDLALII